MRNRNKMCCAVCTHRAIVGASGSAIFDLQAKGIDVNSEARLTGDQLLDVVQALVALKVPEEPRCVIMAVLGGAVEDSDEWLPNALSAQNTCYAKGVEFSSSVEKYVRPKDPEFADYILIKGGKLKKRMLAQREKTGVEARDKLITNAADFAAKPFGISWRWIGLGAAALAVYWAWTRADKALEAVAVAKGGR